MIKIETNPEIIKSFVLHPKLIKTHGFEVDKDNFKIDTSFVYLTNYIDDKPAALAPVKKFNKSCLEAHLFVFPEYQIQNKTVDLTKELIEWVKDNTTYKKIVVTTPKVCKHVINLLNKLNFNKFGELSKGIIYNSERVDLIFYEYEIER